jgi:hypothetical protein
MTCSTRRRRARTGSSTPELSSRPHQQILVVHGDRQVAGGCLGQAPPCVRRSIDPQLGSLLAYSGQPAGEPGGRESGVIGAEPPRARADTDFKAQPDEAVDRRADCVRTEQLSGAFGASLVGVERVCDALVELLGRRELDPACGAERDQRRAAAPRASGPSTRCRNRGRGWSPRRGSAGTTGPSRRALTRGLPRRPAPATSATRGWPGPVRWLRRLRQRLPPSSTFETQLKRLGFAADGLSEVEWTVSVKPT